MTAKPFCPSCHRRHWEVVPTEVAALHCHMRTERFRQAVKDGHGPAPSLADIYKKNRYHVAELDRWLSSTTARSAA